MVSLVKPSKVPSILKSPFLKFEPVRCVLALPRKTNMETGFL